MAWTSLEGDLYGVKVANSVGVSLDALLTTAMEVNQNLSTAIIAIKNQLDDSLEGVSAKYDVTLASGTFADPGDVPAAPDYSSLFDITISMPSAPTLSDAPDVASLSTNFPNAPTLAERPTITAAPTLSDIVAAFPTMGSLPEVPTLSSAPEMGALPAMKVAPEAPELTPLLNTEAYDAAFGLDRDQALAVENAELWAVEYGAAASGVGLPAAAMLAGQSQVRQKKRQALSESAKKQAQLRAEHTREDLRWAYELRLRYWSDVESATLTRWREEQTTKIAAWVQTTANQIELYAKQAGIVSQVFQVGTQAEQARIAALLQNETVKLESWVKSASAALEFWAKPAEVEAQLYQTKVQAESARVQATVSHWGLVVDAWVKEVQSKLDEYKTRGTLEIDSTRAANDSMLARLQAENGRLQAMLQGYQTALHREGEKRAWISAANADQLTKAGAEAADLRELQGIAVKAGQDAVLAYASALAEQFKALLAAASYRADVGSQFGNYVNEQTVHQGE